jgi:hypothetical protein
MEKGLKIRQKEVGLEREGGLNGRERDESDVSWSKRSFRQKVSEG